MTPTDQQAYDRGTTVFSPDGRLYQVEYAREAVRRGSAAVGVRAADGVVLAARRRIRSGLQVPESVEKLHKAAGHVGVATAGHAADARRLVDLGRQEAQRERLRYGEPIGVEALTKAVADHVQESTQVGGTRPYGTALLVAGVDPVGGNPVGEDGTDGVGQPRLFETDPGGTPSEWLATAIGDGDDAIRARLDEEYHPELSLAEAVDLAIEAMAEGGTGNGGAGNGGTSVGGDGDGGGFSPDEVAIGTVDAADGVFRQFDREERRDRLDGLGLLDRAS